MLGSTTRSGKRSRIQFPRPPPAPEAVLEKERRCSGWSRDHFEGLCTVVGMATMKRAPRDGYHALAPRIGVADATAQVEFLRTVFNASGEHDGVRPAEVRIGDSLV